jgi:hypothetical protein
MIKMFFTDRAKSFVLEAFGYSVSDGLIIGPDGKPALTKDGMTIEEDRFAGFAKGWPLRDDLFTVMELAEGNF